MLATTPLTQYSAVLPSKDEAMRACRALAADMLACSPMGLVLGKQQLNAVADGMSLSSALTAENSHQILLVKSPDAAKVRMVCDDDGKAHQPPLSRKDGQGVGCQADGGASGQAVDLTPTVCT